MALEVKTHNYGVGQLAEALADSHDKAALVTNEKRKAG
jgi:hypothetical protein